MEYEEIQKRVSSDLVPLASEAVVRVNYFKMSDIWLLIADSHMDNSVTFQHCEGT